jgi:DNA-binding response OmpR family regulator
MATAGTVVRREDLVRTVLGREFSPYDRSLDTHGCNLRRKIGPLKDGTECIRSIRGTGYKSPAADKSLDGCLMTPCACFPSS